MKTIPLRDFQREGSKALDPLAPTEPLILTGRDQDFLLLPMTPDSRTALLDMVEGLSAILALREDQKLAVETGLDQSSMQDVEEEIREARKSLKPRKRSA